ncbi:MAG: hypothetical protein J6J13_03685, partial [Clostridia bacterium]|nr:hypothetical protein [Clostridia bacterium]
CISEGANSVIKISAFVTFFSSLYAVLSALPLKFLNYVLDTLEVTNTISKCNNLYLIVFWLGFSGISIWCQVFSLIDGCGINYKLFIFSRILHGILSTMFFNAYIHIFNIKIQTISNSVNIIFKDNYAPMHLAVAIFVLVIFLLISFESKRTNILYNDLM